jgi:hypothetical protein
MVRLACRDQWHSNYSVASFQSPASAGITPSLTAIAIYGYL